MLVMEATEVSQALARRWAEEQEAAGPRPYAVEGAKFRHSNATSCGRALYYELQGLPRRPPDLAGEWVMGLGRLVHDAWQDAAVEMFEKDGWTVSAEVKCYIPECESAGHADLMLERDGVRAVVELKTINGVGFREMLKKQQPRDSAFIQGALNAFALDADSLLVIYLAMENVGQRNADLAGLSVTDRFSKVFEYSREEYQMAAMVEIRRWEMIAARDDMPPRSFVEDGIVKVVADPTTATLIGGKKTWRCDYCSFRDQCIEDSLTEVGM